MPDLKITEAIIADGWARPGQGRIRSIVPKGRSEYVIYAVALKEHAGVVKVGRTARWNSRRTSYANWNLSEGDAIDREMVFTITEDFVDLNALEAAILSSLDYPKRHGNEWFVADFEDVCRDIDRFLCAHGLSYV